MGPVSSQMKYPLSLVVLTLGCHPLQMEEVQGPPSQFVSIQPRNPSLTVIFMPDSLPSESEWEFEVPGTFNGFSWECTSKDHCPGDLVCCGQTHLGSSCRDYCDQGLIATLCKSDDECKKEIAPGLGPFPEYKPGDPLCVPMKKGPPGVKKCIMG